MEVLDCQRYDLISFGSRKSPPGLAVWKGHSMNLHPRRGFCSIASPVPAGLARLDSTTSHVSPTLLLCQGDLNPVLHCSGHTEPVLGMLLALTPLSSREPAPALGSGPLSISQGGQKVFSLQVSESPSLA